MDDAETTEDAAPRVLVAAFYKFAPLPDHAALKAPLEAEAAARGLSGSLLLAEEGVNGTMAGAPTALRGFLDRLREDPRLADLTHKESWSAKDPFLRLKVRLKREIVSMGAPGVARPETVGAYAPPQTWNALISRPDVAVIDTRNDYEIAIGRFEGAVDPGVARFRDFPAWADGAAETLRAASAVAMYCTGGIRCEKATAYVRGLGVENVHHLEGGILRYLEEIPESESLWRGACFVFDERAAVDHDLQPSGHGLCRGCRGPIAPDDRDSPLFVDGVCCPRCAPRAEADPARARRLAERQRQIRLAAARGRRHLGPRRG